MNAPASPQSRRAVTAAVIGNVLEWYDFAVYGYVAAIIGKNFFPGTDETTELLKAFLTFGLGFLARPVGGIIIGRMGDTHGRKAALVLTIFLMAVGTVLIGILPTYASIGIAAPALLLVARLMQGFSAGGEWGGSTSFIVEWAPEGRRGLFGSFQQMSVVAGLLLGSAFAALLNTALTSAACWGRSASTCAVPSRRRRTTHAWRQPRRPRPADRPALHSLPKPSASPSSGLSPSMSC